MEHHFTAFLQPQFFSHDLVQVQLISDIRESIAGGSFVKMGIIFLSTFSQPQSNGLCIFPRQSCICK